jgi:osmotically inducible protein OsmC
MPFGISFFFRYFDTSQLRWFNFLYELRHTDFRPPFSRVGKHTFPWYCFKHRIVKSNLSKPENVPGGMMPIRKSKAIWDGDLRSGKGRMKFGSFEGPYSFSSRFEDGQGSNPEELIGAAHAGCFSMKLAGDLTAAGFTPRRINTTANVHLDKVDQGFKITSVELVTEADIPGIDNQKFVEIAEGAKKNCPVSQALSAIDIQLSAKLAGESSKVSR